MYSWLEVSFPLTPNEIWRGDGEAECVKLISHIVD